MCLQRLYKDLEGFRSRVQSLSPTGRGRGICKRYSNTKVRTQMLRIRLSDYTYIFLTHSHYIYRSQTCTETL